MEKIYNFEYLDEPNHTVFSGSPSHILGAMTTIKYNKSVFPRQLIL